MIERTVLLYTKPGRPGLVKTRLVGTGISPVAAAAFHQAFLLDLAERLKVGDFELIPYWALSAGELLPADLPHGRVQPDGDLGRRLHQGFRSLVGSSRLVAAIGSDHPELPLARLAEAFEALDNGADLVLGPALDGGYYLVALRPECVSSRLFADVAWSTPAVLETTLARARELGLAARLLAPLADVDTHADLVALAARLEAAPTLCPRTFALLVRQGWIGEERSCAS